MMHTPMSKVFCRISWAIVALAAVNVGLTPMGYNFFTSDFVMMHMPSGVKFLQYIVGIAGLYSLIKLVMKCMNAEHCNYSSVNCPRCGSMSGCNCNK